jgi:flagellar biosynthetic protein FliR
MNSLDQLAGAALLLVRPGMLVIGTPILGGLYAPVHLRVGLTVLVAILLAPVVALPATLSAAGLTIVIAREIAIGLALALSTRVLVAGLEFAGHFSGYQIGLSAGALIDPQSGVRNTTLALLYGNLAVLLCFLTNAHHLLLHALADSYASLPIGVGAISANVAGSAAEMLGAVFIFGVRVAAPVIIVMLLIELALGLVAKVAPALNVMIAGAPIRLLVGLLVVAATVAGIPAIVREGIPTVLRLAVTLANAFR